MKYQYQHRSQGGRVLVPPRQNQLTARKYLHTWKIYLKGGALISVEGLQLHGSKGVILHTLISRKGEDSFTEKTRM